MSKVSDFINKIDKMVKIRIIVYIVFAFVIFFNVVPAITNAINQTKISINDIDINTGDVGLFDKINIFMEQMGKRILKPISNLRNMSGNGDLKELNASVSKGGLYVYIVLIAVIEYVAHKSKPKSEYENIEHGSSGWANGKEEYALLNKSEGLILGVGKYLDINSRLINKNVLIFGGAGSRKTRGYITPNILQLLGSYVVTDPKGELYDQTAGFLKDNGYDVKVLNLINSEASDCYNPLAHVRNNVDVDIITHAIMQNSSNPNSSADPFWEQSESALLKACMYYLLEKRPKEEQTLINALGLVRVGSDGEVMDNLMKEMDPASIGRGNYNTFNLASDKTRAGVLVGLAARLNAFDTPEIASIMGTNDIDLEGLGQRKTAIFVITPDSHSTYNFIATMFFGQVLQRLYELADKNGGSLDVPVFFLLDEFANVGRIPDFNQKLSTSRSRKINISIILQSIDQLIDLYKDTYENIIANCDSILFLGSQATKTCEYISKSLGEATIAKKTESWSSPKSRGGIPVMSETLSGIRKGLAVDNITDPSRFSLSESEQTMARSLMTIDELKRLDLWTGILLVKGLKPIKTRKYDQDMHPNMKYALEHSINHNESKVADRKPTKRFNPYEVNNVHVMEEQKMSEEELESKFDELFNLNT